MSKLINYTFTFVITALSTNRCEIKKTSKKNFFEALIYITVTI